MNWPPFPQPQKKDPLKRTRIALAPPLPRSRAALGLVQAAAVGAFRLQCCARCESYCYPPRDACPKCFGVDLEWRDCDPHADIVAETTIRSATDPYFRERLPWRIGTARLHGVSIMVNLHRDVATPSRARLTLKLDISGNPVFFAYPITPTPLQEEDPVLRELTAHPRNRRVLISDIRHPVGMALIEPLLAAGARKVFAGLSDPWKPFDGAPILQKHIENGAIELTPMDVTDARGLSEAASAIGGKVDILINTAERVRAGGILSSQGLAEQQHAFDVNVHGLARLAQAFGHAMRGRGADGEYSATAFVDVLPIYAHVNWPAYGAFSASAAARHSLLQCLRAEMRAGGIRVIGVYAGPLDDSWRQELPPPKVTAKQIADSIVRGLVEGLEDVIVGDIAQDIVARHWRDPKALEREMGQ